ncbi:Uncharacterised protein [Mycobacterium tuberculosis]|nr:Uncharacterised protein [Mycobacterium tuberculosis]
MAVSTFTPALNVLSTTLPESTFFNLVRTNAGPLPGLTCWNSVIVHSWPSITRTSPFLKSAVVATWVSYRMASSLGNRVNNSGVCPAVSGIFGVPPATTNVSSMRTPPRPGK